MSYNGGKASPLTLSKKCPRCNKETPDGWLCKECEDNVSQNNKINI